MEELSALRLARQKKPNSTISGRAIDGGPMARVVTFFATWFESPTQIFVLSGLALVSSGFILIGSALSVWNLIGFLLLSVCLGMLVVLALLYTRQREQALHFEETIEAITDIYWHWDLKTGSFEYNGRMSELLGYDDRKPTDGFWKEIIHPQDRALQKYQLLRHMADETQPYYCEYRILDCNQEYQWFAGRGKVVSRDQDQQPILMVGSIEHIQPRKDMEQTLMRAHKMEALGQLTGGIAHDFNNILGTVLGYAELSLDSDSPRKMQEYAQNIYTAGGRARDVVRQLLDFSRSSGGEEVVVDIQQEIESALVMARSTLSSAIAIDTSMPEEKCFTKLNPNQLQRVLLNLCINARDAMSGRGHLNIQLEALDIGSLLKVSSMAEHKVFCSSCQQAFSGAYQKLSISDDGCGFDQDIQGRLFEPFFTTKSFGEGTGMGLSVVHGIVHECGGHIIIESEPGTGTCISLYLPAAEKQPKLSSNSEPLTAARG